MTKVDLIIKNAKQLVFPTENERGESFLKILTQGAVACHQGKIVEIGESSELLNKYSSQSIIDATGKVVSPGFVDAHTHPIFFGSREHEFEQRNRGKSYAEIARAGGGIRFSVRQLRQASKEQLIQHALPYLDRFIEHGTTTIEAKSGYGLSLEDEIKSLEVIQELNRVHPLDLIPTFLGAHEIPDEFRDQRELYIAKIINEMLPVVAERRLAEFCDIFCESQVFTVAESERILTAARSAGLKLKIHADQLTAGGGTELATQLAAVSADHLDYVSDAAIEKLKKVKTIPVLLPGAVFFLGLKHYAPARKLINAGLRIALATDFNPGSCMTESLPIILTIASIYMKLSPQEVWLAVTSHAAAAVSSEKKIGTLLPEAQADIVIWNIPNFQYLPYHFGVNLVDQVIKKGKLVWKRQS